MKISCACHEVELEVIGEPFTSAECYCTSCRSAADRLQALPAAPQIADARGGTHFVLHRKDRVRFVKGQELLREFRLSSDARTRRVIATCCNTPVFMELHGGHWLSLYAGLWPAGKAPAPELRTMVSDLPAGTTLPNDIPNARTQTLSFYWKLFKAWAGMGFRNPDIAVPGKLEA